jgi:hypothetical protein
VERDCARHPPAAVVGFAVRSWLGRITTPDESAQSNAFPLSNDAHQIAGKVGHVTDGFRR